MKLGESAEDYLESILILSKDLEYVRAIDICSYFGYARATVSIYLKQLKENGFVYVDELNHITLTEEGLNIAKDVYERHEFLTRFFVSLGVPKAIAMQDACKIEHHVSAETFNALKNHFTNL